MDGFKNKETRINFITQGEEMGKLFKLYVKEKIK